MEDVLNFHNVCKQEWSSLLDEAGYINNIHEQKYRIMDTSLDESPGYRSGC